MAGGLAEARIRENLERMKRVAFYVRVSTADGQSTENQTRALHEVAARSGWNVTAIFSDDGISGSKGRDRRPGLDALLKAVTRREVDLVAAWSVDRLGRSLPDLINLLGELQGRGVDLFLHQQALDTSTPGGRMMFQMLGVFAEFERSLIRSRVMAGLERTRAKGTRLGRPPIGDREGGSDPHAAGVRRWHPGDGAPDRRRRLDRSARARSDGWRAGRCRCSGMTFTRSLGPRSWTVRKPSRTVLRYIQEVLITVMLQGRRPRAALARQP